MSKAQELKLELLPCPMCGGTEILVKKRKTTMVECKACGLVVFDCQDGVGRDAIAHWNRRAARSEQQSTPRVQWWLAAIDTHGNPTLTDGAHADRAGADQAAYLIEALGVGKGKKYAVARVELSEPKPNADGVNQEAIAQCNLAALAARASNGGRA